MLTLSSIFILYAIAVMSPGPNLIVLLTKSIQQGRIAGVMVSAGITVGALFYSLLSLYGVSKLLVEYSDIYFAIVIISSLYIMLIGVQILRSNTGSELPGTSCSLKLTRPNGNHFLAGLLVSLSNIKSILFFTSIFSLYAQLIKDSGAALTIIATFTAIEAIWYVSISFLVTHSGSGFQIQSHMKTINTVFGVLMIAIGMLGLTSFYTEYTA